MKIPSEMMVAQVARPGAPRFEVTRVPVPRPGPGQILIRVEACGVNFADVKRRRGDAYPAPTTFPFVPGSEVAGEVVAHGPGVDGPPIGARVFALAGATGEGGYAQFALSYAPTATPIPPGLDAAVASTLLVAGTTAALMLREVARLGAGETVLVPAAVGGVGSFALQLARRAEAGMIIALVGDEAKRARARALGADHVVIDRAGGWADEVTALTGGRGVDVALEASGGPALGEALRCLAPFGRLVVYGAASGEGATLPPAALAAFLYAPAPNQSIAAFNVGGWFMHRPHVAGRALAALVADVLAGRIAPPPIRALGLGAAATAHELLEARRSSGKMVLEPWT